MTLYFFADESGKNSDPNAGDDVCAAMGSERYETAVAWVHGWLTRAQDFVAESDRAMVGLMEASAFPKPTLGMALHWPSTLSEDRLSVLNLFDVATFGVMSARADGVGKNALCALSYSAIKCATGPLHLILIGHSFGCRAICAALTQLALAGTDLTNVRIDVVLLQAALTQADLSPAGIYGPLLNLSNLRMLVTTSRLDRALRDGFPVAMNLLSPPQDHTAVGYGGVGDEAKGFLKDRLQVLDITDWQAAFPIDNAFGDQHSNIYLPQIYAATAAFLKG